MLSPVRTIAPADLPVSLAEAKRHCRVDCAVTEDDDLIGSFIEAATAHLDGWSGVLGRALMNQTWRQDFSGFSGCMRLPLAPCSAIDAITYVDGDSVERTLSDGVYTLLSDARGPFVSLAAGQSWPSALRRPDAVSVSFVAGYGAEAGKVPAPLRTAIMMTVAHLYANREAVGDGALAALPFGVDALIAPYRRVGI